MVVGAGVSAHFGVGIGAGAGICAGVEWLCWLGWVGYVGGWVGRLEGRYVRRWVGGQ